MTFGSVRTLYRNLMKTYNLCLLWASWELCLRASWAIWVARCAVECPSWAILDPSWPSGGARRALLRPPGALQDRLGAF
eukprot:2202117-Pyramimonas_sp.AAC.1